MSEDGTTNEDGTTGEFVTVVLVYRTHGEAADSVHEKLVSELPYGDEIMFLSVNDGVTESALALGADQSSWAYDDELLDDIPDPLDEAHRERDAEHATRFDIATSD